MDGDALWKAVTEHMTQIAVRSLVGRAAALLVVASSIASCATGREPSLPTAEDYSRSCSDLIAAYEKADRKVQDRKVLSSASDLAIGAATVVLAVSSSIGVGLPLGAIALSQIKGDFGASAKASDRDALRALAVAKGCTADDVAQRRAERAHPDLTKRSAAR